MKSNTYLFTVLLLLMSLAILALTAPDGREKGITFTEVSWKEALIKAKKEDKLIFLDVYANWCGPCKKLKQSTFLDEEAGKYFNEIFINISIDGETREGRSLIEKYGLRGYPSLLLIDQNGAPVKLATGFLSAKQFLAWAQK